MNDDMLLDEERQRLFIMVWERPTQEVARELGISDVALAKRCKKLQVQNPLADTGLASLLAKHRNGLRCLLIERN